MTLKWEAQGRKEGLGKIQNTSLKSELLKRNCLEFSQAQNEIAWEKIADNGFSLNRNTPESGLFISQSLAVVNAMAPLCRLGTQKNHSWYFQHNTENKAHLIKGKTVSKIGNLSFLNMGKDTHWNGMKCEAKVWEWSPHQKKRGDFSFILLQL